MKSIRLSLVSVCVSLSLLALTFSGTAYAQCTTPFASQPSIPSTDETWIDDSLPAGASVSTGTLTWDTSQYAEGSQSIVLSGSGTQTLRIIDMAKFVKIGGKTKFYVLLDPCSVTQQIKVTYYTPYRQVSVYWGSDLITGGPVKFRRGNLPSTGSWTRLEVPAAFPLRIEGQDVTSIQLEIYDGRVWFDSVGTDGAGCTPTVASAPSIPSTDVVWFDDAFPSGTSTLGSWDWDPDQKASGTQSVTAPYFGQSVMNSWRVIDMSQATNSGDDLVAYVLLNDCVAVRELKILWYTATGQGGVYWGESLLGGEGSLVYQGATLPASGSWQRIAIPASTVGLDGQTITSVKFEWYAGQVWVDSVGNAP